MNKIESQPQKPQRPNPFHVAFNGAMLELLDRQMLRHNNDFDSLPPEVKCRFSRTYKTRNPNSYAPEHLTIYRIQQPETDEARYTIMKELGIDYEAYTRANPVRFALFRKERRNSRKGMDGNILALLKELGLNDEPPELLKAQQQALQQLTYG